MLKKAKFKVEFKVKEPTFLAEKWVEREECFILPYRTEESYHHVSSLVYRSAIMEIIKSSIGEGSLISIKRICLLTKYEKVRPSISKNTRVIDCNHSNRNEDSQVY